MQKWCKIVSVTRPDNRDVFIGTRPCGGPMTGPGRSTLTAFDRLDDAPDRLPQPHFDCPSLLPPSYPGSDGHVENNLFQENVGRMARDRRVSSCRRGACESRPGSHAQREGRPRNPNLGTQPPSQARTSPVSGCPWRLAFRVAGRSGIDPCSIHDREGQCAERR